MIPIEKGVEPKVFAEAKREIKATPDASLNYESLRGERKREILECLMAEQGYLCAYCMCRIGVEGSLHASIEHLIPQHPASGMGDGELSLSYNNMVAVCDGREGKTCDKKRGNAPLTVDPTKPHTLETIFYHRDGKIDAGDPKAQHDIQETLGLNDPETFLVESRRNAMLEMESLLRDAIVKKKIEGNKSAKEKVCKRILEHYENQENKKDQYLGAKLFKARQFVAKFAK